MTTLHKTKKVAIAKLRVDDRFNLAGSQMTVMKLEPNRFNNMIIHCTKSYGPKDHLYTVILPLGFQILIQRYSKKK
jgi:hypothetical protein